MSYMRLGAAVSMGLALVTAACGSSSGSHSTSATVRRLAPTTTVGVDQVPAVIDVAYVQRVMDALDQVLGDAIRALVAAREPNREFYDRLRAVYGDPEFARQEASYGREAANGLAIFRPSPGNPVTVVQRLIAAQRACLFAAVDRSLAQALNEAPRPGTTAGYIALKPKTAD